MKGRQAVHERTGKVLAEELEMPRTMFGRGVGLMFRRTLDAGRGMWIIPCSGIHMMFMNFPIDAVFLDGRERVKKVYRKLPRWYGVGWWGVGCRGRGGAPPVRLGETPQVAGRASLGRRLRGPGGGRGAPLQIPGLATARRSARAADGGAAGHRGCGRAVGGGGAAAPGPFASTRLQSGRAPCRGGAPPPETARAAGRPRTYAFYTAAGRPGPSAQGRKRARRVHMARCGPER